MNFAVAIASLIQRLWSVILGVNYTVRLCWKPNRDKCYFKVCIKQQENIEGW